MPDADKLLDTLSETLAKWCYETIDFIIAALMQLRNLCALFDRAWFPNPQDAAEFAALVYACRWKKLWRFLVIAHKFGIQKLEKAADGALYAILQITNLNDC